MPKEYSTKFKTEVIKRYQNGESILALSQELRIAQSTIYHWRKRVLLHQSSKSYLYTERV